MPISPVWSWSSFERLRRAWTSSVSSTNERLRVLKSCSVGVQSESPSRRVVPQVDQSDGLAPGSTRLRMRRPTIGDRPAPFDSFPPLIQACDEVIELTLLILFSIVDACGVVPGGRTSGSRAA